MTQQVSRRARYNVVPSFTDFYLLLGKVKVNAYVMENRYMINSKVLNRNAIRLVGLRISSSGNRYGSFSGGSRN